MERWRLLVSKGRKKLFWRRYFDFLRLGVLSLVTVILITGIIYVFKLYPRIPDISLVYLLVVLMVVRKYGFFFATLFTIFICFCFDFFLIPPQFTLTIGHIEESFALFLFLLVAMALGFLCLQWRKSVQEASDQVRKTRVIYETASHEYMEKLTRREFQIQTLFQLIGAINSEKDLKHQLHLVTEAIVTASSSYGIIACSIFSSDPDEDRKTLVLQAKAPQRSHWAGFSHDEEICAKQVMASGRSILIPGGFAASRMRSNYIRNIIRSKTARSAISRRDTHLLPLKNTDQVVGVLRLIVDSQNASLLPAFEDQLDTSSCLPGAQEEFFWKLYSLAVSVIERANMESEKLRRRTQKLQDAIISSVSHSLRTPLTTIMGRTTDLLQADISWEDNARRNATLNIITCEAERLNRLVKKLLDMSCIQGGKLEPCKVLYPIEALISGTLEPGYLQDLLMDRKISLDMEPGLPAVEVDPVRIGQILENLLENAAHYTPAGSPIEIRAKVESDSLLISVADRGPGIKPGDTERIFDKFCRGAMTYPPSTGIGLTICRGLVEAHGGSIWAENRPGGGALFQFTLPRTEEHEL